MTTAEFLNDFIQPTSHKMLHSLDEFHKIKANPNVKMVKATTFYQIYKHNTFGSDGERLTLHEFYRISSQYFYYDKYVCDHGTEFYYYVIFNEDNKMYDLTKDIIKKRIDSNRPELLKDLLYVVEAVTKEN